MEIKYKTCGACKESKPLFEFRRNKASTDGLTNYCAECIKSRKKKSELETMREKLPEIMGDPTYVPTARGRKYRYKLGHN